MEIKVEDRTYNVEKPKDISSDTLILYRTAMQNILKVKSQLERYTKFTKKTMGRVITR